MDNDDLLNLIRVLPGGEELSEALTRKDIELMTYGELGKALGVKENEKGFDGLEFYNACLNCHGNPNVTSLPREERLRVIATVAAALDSMRSP